MAENNKVTIDAAWFAELWKIANEADEVCKDCVREKCGACKVVNERDELKAKLELKDEQCKECAALCASKLQYEELTKERDDAKRAYDELKRDLEATEQERDEMRRECEAMKNRPISYLEEFNSERAAREDLMKELNLTRELNGRVCVERDAQARKIERMGNSITSLEKIISSNEIVNNNLGSRLAAAERCIEDIEAVMRVSVIAECAEGMKVNDIIRAWREKREAK